MADSANRSFPPGFPRASACPDRSAINQVGFFPLFLSSCAARKDSFHGASAPVSARPPAQGLFFSSVCSNASFCPFLFLAQGLREAEGAFYEPLIPAERILSSSLSHPICTRSSVRRASIRPNLIFLSSAATTLFLRRYILLKKRPPPPSVLSHLAVSDKSYPKRFCN